ncbi:type II secretion system protein [Criibacterium bergeronii]|nr:type II secretion system protein [Criibacterium bergeronii]MBS6064164.1 type II secretion system protein [Peptostreptococcaceae bacterium]
MKKNKGFTMAEMLVAIAILTILMGLAVPFFKPAKEFVNKNKTNTTKKILINAIEYWSKDNINPIQKPADFNAVNSQNKKVFEYISNNEVYKDSNMQIEEKDGNKELVFVNDKDNDGKDDTEIVIVNFEKGVLTTSYLNSDNELSNSTAFLSIQNLENLGATSIENYEDKHRKFLILEKNDGYKELVYDKPKLTP